ncbi:hypothetical protein A8C56_01135 [Niabella ginsenosidivorans]|uniref:DUF4296 domain-containing protein n=1 Tax=Niabella ginsenosidivorans TaxID=1176587 RepID=A0A1A9HY60_9BACT|nr:hypothetical protein [Niabella ginsenosidivorans]ANH79759.1 hypothetical protein A8C56_01135 [Niabella ginsenosidivorans]
MKLIFIFFIPFLLFCRPLNAQQPSGSSPQPKVVDAFLDFLTEKIHLTPTERNQMRPLIVGYFSETRRINKTITDPLQREQERAALKISYRKSFTPILGNQRATRFFTEEQLFRRKIREVLKGRNVKKN